MSFDPTKPVEGTEIDAAELRGQFNGLKTLLDAIPSGQVGPAGPAGRDGNDGAIGPEGPQGEKGDKGDTGDQGPQGNDGRNVVGVYDDGSGLASIQMSDGSSYGPFIVASGQQGPQGEKGDRGDQGPQGNQGDRGDGGPQGPPGEVSTGQLDMAIATTSANSNAIELIALTPSDPPTASDLQAVIDKVNELITALRR